MKWDSETENATSFISDRDRKHHTRGIETTTNQDNTTDEKPDDVKRTPSAELMLVIERDIF